MQIFAFDQTGAFISALQAERKKEYACPECGGPLHVRGGVYRRAHFYHLSPNASCRLSKKSFHHIAVQLFLEQLLPSCALEVPFPQIRRIADCVWEERKLVFEIQCSPISAVEIKKRSFDYHSVGYKTVWILHDKTFNQKTLSLAEKALQKIPHYYTNINEEGEGFIYDQYIIFKQRKRLGESSHFSVNLSKPSFANLEKQIASNCRSLLYERLKHWKVSFSGDLLQTTLFQEETYTLKKLLISSKKETFLHFFRYILNRLLEKACR